mmetsp:Transcript_144858/g.252612  ORF Transcript_144858/g.252612 Transcript_144858/m.252612 type:complete len:211 (+) Transcript_144858:3602-4234(+)
MARKPLERQKMVSLSWCFCSTYSASTTVQSAAPESGAAGRCFRCCSDSCSRAVVSKVGTSLLSSHFCRTSARVYPLRSGMQTWGFADCFIVLALTDRASPTTRAKSPSRPAAQPTSDSSMTTVCSGDTPNLAAAAFQASGAGNPCNPSASNILLFTKTSSKLSTPACLRACSELVDMDTAPTMMSLFFKSFSSSTVLSYSVRSAAESTSF